MKLSEASALLSFMAAFDQRTIGEADAMAWSSVLGNISLADAQEAVRRHYKASTDRAMPAHIVAGVQKILEEASGVPVGPGLGSEVPDADPDDLRGYMAALRAGKTVTMPGSWRAQLESGIKAVGTSASMPHREATPMQVSCRFCQAPVGKPCRSFYRDRRFHAERLEDFTNRRSNKG